MLSLALLGLVLQANAATPPDVQITSFYLVGTGTERTAEICGKVTGDFTGAHRVEITVDPDNNPGSYVTWPAKNGAWCSIVQSYTGRAEAALWDGTAESGRAVASATRQR
jgi:hypothetical protein